MTTQIRYIGDKSPKRDTIAGTQTVWRGHGDVQAVPDQAAATLLRYPTVWADASEPFGSPATVMTGNASVDGETGNMVASESADEPVIMSGEVAADAADTVSDAPEVEASEEAEEAIEETEPFAWTADTVSAELNIKVTGDQSKDNAAIEDAAVKMFGDQYGVEAVKKAVNRRKKTDTVLDELAAFLNAGPAAE